MIKITRTVTGGAITDTTTLLLGDGEVTDMVDRLVLDWVRAALEVEAEEPEGNTTEDEGRGG